MNVINIDMERSPFMYVSQPQPAYPLLARVQGAVVRARDWLDARGKAGWIVATILAFVLVWPLGLALLAYVIWSKRMFGCNTPRAQARYYAPSTGNTAFDAYREETLRRLESEHRDFMDFLQKLREAKDKAEFDQFMEQRGDKPEPSTPGNA